MTEKKRETNHKKRSASSAVEFLGLASDAPYFALERRRFISPVDFSYRDRLIIAGFPSVDIVSFSRSGLPRRAERRSELARCANRRHNLQGHACAMEWDLGWQVTCQVLFLLCDRRGALHVFAASLRIQGCSSSTVGLFFFSSAADSHELLITYSIGY